MDYSILIVFLFVYFGMIMGNIPGLAIDRTGIALLGAIGVILLKKLSLFEASTYIDMPSIALLFSFMIISAQFYYSGFYSHLISKVQGFKLSPELLLGLIILISGLLSAVLINDIVCLALTPPVAKLCFRKKLNPIPYLLAVACASNIGSALTLIGNPQNILIGQVMRIPFAGYTLNAIVPCFLGLAATWAIIKWQVKGKWHHETKNAPVETQEYFAWQSYKGLIAIAILLTFFLFLPFPREHVSLAIAGMLLLSRKMASKNMLNFIDWQLLVLFIGLFIVNQEFNKTHFMPSFLGFLNAHQIHLESPSWLFIISVILSNVISNVPAVMLLIPFAETHGSMLALTSTLAGNLFLVGSIANIIVVTQAAEYGVKIDWKKHLKVGLPVGIISLVITALWLYFLEYI